jgi:hypothetical protein
MSIQQVFQNDPKGATSESGVTAGRPNSEKNNMQPLEGGFGKQVDPNSQTVRNPEKLGKGVSDVNSQTKRNEGMKLGKGGNPNDQTIRNSGMPLGKGASDVNSQKVKMQMPMQGSVGIDRGLNSQKTKGSRNIN